MVEDPGYRRGAAVRRRLFAAPLPSVRVPVIASHPAGPGARDRRPYRGDEVGMIASHAAAPGACDRPAYRGMADKGCRTTATTWGRLGRAVPVAINQGAHVGDDIGDPPRVAHHLLPRERQDRPPGVDQLVVPPAVVPQGAPRPVMLEAVRLDGDPPASITQVDVHRGAGD